MKASRDISTIHKRIECWEHTKQLANMMPLPPESIKVEWLPDIVILPSDKPITNVAIINGDTLEVAREMISRGLNPLVLNLADNCFPGGHVDAGSGAQEESLFRCTNLCETLNYSRLSRGTYPIHPYQAMLSQNISVLKESEGNSWRQLEQPLVLDIISCPGIRNPSCGPNGRFPDDAVEMLKKKVELIYQTAIANGNNSIVMGALGCGAWRCPAEHVAEIMYDVTKKWAYLFKEINYAILSGAGDGYIVNNRIGNNIEDNYVIFSRVFG